MPSLQPIAPPSDNFEFVFTKADAAATTTIHVLDSYANFNVTRSMSFNGIEFRGENALALAASTYTGPPLATVPVKKCTLAAEVDGTNTAPSFTLSTDQALLTGQFSCADGTFVQGNIPMVPEVACTQSADTSTIGSVRACRGEPYSSDFFTFDSVTGIPYLRHRVLFNLYNWDRQRSYSKANRATLTLTDCQFHNFLADYEALIHV